MDDVGLQRAIWASMQTARAPPQPQPRAQSFRSDIRPTMPSTRSSYQPVRQVASSSNMYHTRDVVPAGTGRKNVLAREGVVPQSTHGAATRVDRVRSPTKPIRGTGETAGLYHPQPRPGRSSVGSTGVGAAKGPDLRRGNEVKGWTDVCRGGKLQRQNPSGSHLQLTCEDGYDSDGFQVIPSDYCLLSVTSLPPELVTTRQPVSIIMNVKMTFHSSRAMMFGIVLNYDNSASCASFILACLRQQHGGKYQAQILRCLIRDQNIEVTQELSHTASVTPKPQSSLCVTRRDDRIDFIVNGNKVFKNVSVAGSALDSSRFGLLGIGCKAQVREIQCREGEEEVVRERGVERDTTYRERGTYNEGMYGRDTRESSRPKSAAKPSQDDKYMQMIEQDILDTNPNVQWEDIAALSEAKRLLNEAVVLPMIIPEFFTGIRAPWQGVLLFGPPGTGKTLLAKAVATCANTTFFNMTASSLISKWHGESEKMIKTLFALARKHAPSTIFFDEIDSLMMKRGDSHEHEASRRLKSELLSEMSGMHTNSEHRIMILATTNKPWDLDEAFRRRLEKRIYIPLPEEEAREELFRINLKGMSTDANFRELARMTEGYSGADIHQICRDASMGPMRRLIAHKSPAEIAKMKQEGVLDAVTVPSMGDFIESVKKIQPSVNQTEIQKYKIWERDFASV
eukprot:TRINITY_DN5723_c0_g1_i2.p1 TRINITY_DN5723_c0_g1~~TRINITY_DN5723_c0_g1_i2.p1  ORF type:complete len:681 (+),score=172.80 TRINITY_DN5723_c0_g1_i2:35-2077(+)